MPIERHRRPVTITTVARSTLAEAHHKEIDTILKDLRYSSRRLKSALDSFKDELRTLERLYYKSKNQHRMAPFFKRVSEIRRYGQRLSELHVPERVDLLRASFVGLERTNDQKALRGSWSHMPEKPYVCFLVERLMACSALVCKMRERLANAYRHFTLAMQTGAFVQLVILFVAISSRMSVLSSELDEALQLSVSTSNRLLMIIHPKGSTTTSQQLPSAPGTSRPARAECEVPDVSLEDTGHSVSRCEPVDISASVVEEPSVKIQDTPDVRTTSPTNGASDRAVAQASKTTTTKVQKPQHKKARKKFDEIDEIFGF